MRAILIDPINQALTEIELPDGDTEQSLDKMQQAVGGYLEIAHGLANGDVIFVDEEGKLKGPVKGWFAVKGASEPAYAGNGLVVGTSGPHSVSAKSSIEELEQLVSFVLRIVRLRPLQ